MLIALLSLVGYFFIAMICKTYYKLYRHTGTMSEDPYLIGLGWPLYLVYRLIAWPFVSCTRYMENKVLELRKEKEEPKVRVEVAVRDRDYEEAEEEVESMLRRERSL